MAQRIGIVDGLDAGALQSHLLLNLAVYALWKDFQYSNRERLKGYCSCVWFGSLHWPWLFAHVVVNVPANVCTV